MRAEVKTRSKRGLAASLLLACAIVSQLSVPGYSIPVSTASTGSRIENWLITRYVGDDPSNYKDLDARQKQLIDDYYAEKVKGQNTTAEKLYDALKADQKLHFEGITNAMAKTKVFDLKGDDTGKTVLDLIKGLDTSKKDARGEINAIRGKDVSGKGNESYRIYVTFNSDAIDTLGTSTKNFELSGAKLHKGMTASYRQTPGQPSLQVVYNASKTAGEVDIDFDHDSGGVVTAIFTFGSKGSAGLHNSNIDFKDHRKAYETKYGQIPIRSPK
ncbi:MAG: hypothetical protein ABL952_08290 [Pyrinomonadaceae bacterium]